MIRSFFLFLCLGSVTTVAAPKGPSTSITYIQKYNDLHLLWRRYCARYIENGRVISHDEGGITTSEGQSYAMLRAVWMNDREIFDQVWQWTRKNLMIREDFLFASIPIAFQQAHSCARPFVRSPTPGLAWFRLLTTSTTKTFSNVHFYHLTRSLTKPTCSTMAFWVLATPGVDRISWAVAQYFAARQ